MAGGELWPRWAGAWPLARRGRLVRSPSAAAVLEVPLLFESGMETVFDKTIAVVAAEARRAERGGGRGHAAWPSERAVSSRRSKRRRKRTSRCETMAPWAT